MKRHSGADARGQERPGTITVLKLNPIEMRHNMAEVVQVSRSREDDEQWFWALQSSIQKNQMQGALFLAHLNYALRQNDQHRLASRVSKTNQDANFPTALPPSPSRKHARVLAFPNRYTPRSPSPTNAPSPLRSSTSNSDQVLASSLPSSGKPSGLGC